jgi:hypothetical protein
MAFFIVTAVETSNLKREYIYAKSQQRYSTQNFPYNRDASIHAGKADSCICIRVNEWSRPP